MSLTLFAVVLMLVLVTKWLRIYREQLLMELRNRQNRHAVYRINRRIYRGLHQRSFGMKTDADYLEKLMTTYPSVPARIGRSICALCRKRSFPKKRFHRKKHGFVTGCTGSIETGGFWKNRITENRLLSGRRSVYISGCP